MDHFIKVPFTLIQLIKKYKILLLIVVIVGLGILDCN